jgi:enediyne biosynthesis protein E4
MDLLSNVGRRSNAGGDLGNFVNVGGMSLNGYEHKNLYRNIDGVHFEDVGYLTATDRLEDGRAVAAVDIDNDGDLDLVTENYLQPARLLVNPGSPGNHWIELKLVGSGPARGGSSRSAFGARVFVEAGGRRMTREVVSSQGYLSGTTQTLHFGLGKATVVDRLEIRWPSGRVQTLLDVPADRKHRIQEAGGEPGLAGGDAAPRR